MTALLSVDGSHRYRLSRSWPAVTESKRGRDGVAIHDGRALFVMLNPSTADAETDDATIRKCRGFAARWGCAGLDVVNLYSFRSRHPSEMFSRYDANTAESDGHIIDAVPGATIIVAAWGHWPQAIDRARHVDALIRACLVALGHSPVLRRIGELTDDGHPRHPLMPSYASPLCVWDGYK